MPSAAELRHLFDYHRPRRHVDPESERLGGKDDLHECLGEACLHRFPERWHHAGVMGRHACLEAGRIDRVAEHRQVIICQRIDIGLDDRAYPIPLLRRGQAQPVVQAVPDRLVAAGS